MSYDPAGRYGLTTLTANVSNGCQWTICALLGFDLGLKDGVGDIDLKMRGPGRNAAAALNSASGTVESPSARAGGRAMVWPAGRPKTLKLLGAADGAAFNCLAGGSR